LGIGIDQKDIPASGCESGGKVNDGRGLANTAFLIRDREDLAHLEGLIEMRPIIGQRTKHEFAKLRIGSNEGYPIAVSRF